MHAFLYEEPFTALSESEMLPLFQSIGARQVVSNSACDLDVTRRSMVVAPIVDHLASLLEAVDDVVNRVERNAHVFGGLLWVARVLAAVDVAAEMPVEYSPLLSLSILAARFTSNVIVLDADVDARQVRNSIVLVESLKRLQQIEVIVRLLDCRPWGTTTRSSTCLTRSRLDFIDTPRQ